MDSQLIFETSKSDDPSRLSGFASSGSAFTFTLNSTNSQMCCLSEDGIRCNRISGNASYSKRIQKTVQQKKLRLSIDSSARHVYICDHHKNMIQSVRSCVKRKRKDSCEDENGNNSNDAFIYSSSLYSNDFNGDQPSVDLSTLQMNTLRRYKRHYRVQTRPGINKSQLADSLLNHFRGIHVDEKETIAFFIYMVKSNRNKLDQMKGLIGGSVLPNSGSISDQNSS